MNLTQHKKIIINQRHEMAELFGLEFRNKYEVLDETENVLGFAAEQQKGFLGFLFRQTLGHWRQFEIHFFNTNRQLMMKAVHPFRWFFQHMDVYNDQSRYLGCIDQKFSIISKKFNLYNSQGKLLLEVNSGFFKIWTFEFMVGEKKAARITKKWSGLLAEAFTDKDKFLVEFINPNMSEEERQLVLAAALFIDLQYFERKAGSNNN